MTKSQALTMRMKWDNKKVVLAKSVFVEMSYSHIVFSSQWANSGGGRDTINTKSWNNFITLKTSLPTQSSWKLGGKNIYRKHKAKNVTLSKNKQKKNFFNLFSISYFYFCATLFLHINFLIRFSMSEIGFKEQQKENSWCMQIMHISKV